MRIRTIFDRMRQDGRGGRGKAELLTGIEGFQPLASISHTREVHRG